MEGMGKQTGRCYQKLEKFKPYLELIKINLQIGNCDRIMEIGKRLEHKGLQQRALEFIDSHLGECMERNDKVSLIGSLIHSKKDLESLSFLLQTTGLKNVCRKRGLLAALLALFHKDADIFKSYFAEHIFHSFENSSHVKTTQESSRFENRPKPFSEHKQRLGISSSEKHATWEKRVCDTQTVNRDRFLSQYTLREDVALQNQSLLTGNQFKPHNGASNLMKTRLSEFSANDTTLNTKNTKKNDSSISHKKLNKLKRYQDTKRKPTEGVVNIKSDAIFPQCRYTVQARSKAADHCLASPTRVCKLWNSEPQAMIVVVGGIVSTENLNPSCSVQLYDPTTNSWQSLPPMRHPRVNHAVTAFDGQVYVAGGNKGDFTQTNTVEKYDFSSCAWSDVFPMTEVREELSLVQVGNNFYAIGGYNGKRDLASVEYYNAQDDIWRFSTPLHSCRAGASVVVDGQYIYVIGGSCNQHHMTSLDVYDTTTHTWYTCLQSMREARSYACAAIVEKSIYVMGGFNESGYLNTCEVFDMKEWDWRWFPSMLRRRVNAGVATIDDKIYIFGGESDGSFLSSVERYDVKRGEWEIVTELPTTLTGSRATSVVLKLTD